MKKILFAIALGAIMVVSCTKEPENNTPVGQTVTIRAFSEPYTEIDPNGAVTKGTLDAEGHFLWADGDQIGVRLYKGNNYNGTWTYGDDSYNAWDGTFELDSGYGGQSAGSFTCTTTLDQYVNWGYAAFYPKFDNNISNSDGKVYFEMKNVYENYTSGTCLMPMVASLGDGKDGLQPTDFSFKHVGAGVRVTLKDVPANANQVSLTVAGKNIANGTNNTAWFGVNPAQAGTDCISATDGAENTIYLKFATASAKRDITFIFPLPTVDLSGGITLKLYYDKSGESLPVEFWSKKASTLPTLTRGQLLDMPDITVPVDPDGDVTLYFNLDESIAFTDLKLCCEAIGTAGWPGSSLDLTNTETIMLKKYYKYVTKASNVWGKTPDIYLYGVSSENWATAASSVNFTSKKMEYFFTLGSNKYGTITQLSGRPTPPKPVSISIDGSMTDWDKLSTKWTSGNNDRVKAWKATYDASNIYIYMEIDESYATANGKWSSYVEAAFDVDNKQTTPTGVSTDYGFGAGWEAIAIVFPFTNSSGASSATLANSANDSHLDVPFGTVITEVVSKGIVDSGTVYLEFAVSRTSIGASGKGPVYIKVGGGSHLLDGQYLFIE